VLDFVEFLEARYAVQSAAAASPFQKLAETVEDTLRAGRVPVNAIKSTMDAMAAASRMMGGLAAAGKAVVDEVAGAAGVGRPAEPPARTEPSPKPETKTATPDTGAATS
jgi:hypothetical protein